MLTGTFRPGGANPLATYLLPDYWEFLGLFGLSFFSHYFRYGWQGVVKAMLFACLMLAIAAFLTRRKIRLAL